ncbi:MAG: hypothetical protein RMI34_12755 [Chloroherpetonaceae bacterium]|nr:hypothetical protein [Chloroherpetonaceae bacterium]MCS7210663.1 hypothetical protein [Chloroherpetonaceae bacterium]MDW8020928.1 hypothetical protein [Chloroherpetonaceae bacterium]
MQTSARSILGEWQLELASRAAVNVPIYLCIKESANRDTVIMIDSVRLQDGTVFRQELRLPVSLSAHTIERSEVVKWHSHPTSLHIEYYQRISKPDYILLVLDFELEDSRLRLRKIRRELGTDEIETLYYRPFRPRKR